MPCYGRPSRGRCLSARGEIWGPGLAGGGGARGLRSAAPGPQATRPQRRDVLRAVPETHDRTEHRCARRPHDEEPRDRGRRNAVGFTGDAAPQGGLQVPEPEIDPKAGTGDDVIGAHFTLTVWVLNTKQHALARLSIRVTPSHVTPSRWRGGVARCGETRAVALRVNPGSTPPSSFKLARRASISGLVERIPPLTTEALQ